ncbi:MAG: amidohydrolase family protein [Lachnospiraceae bacterium]|nr:amidohydrolase family protein [Lachnospiraceae bacterium]
MIIDFHTHVFPAKIAPATIAKLEGLANIKAFTDGTIQGLLACMERSSVDISVVLPVVTRPAQFQTINENAVKLNEEYAGKIISFGGIHPDSADGTTEYKSQLRQIKDMGLKGIKLHPDYQDTFFNDIKYKRIVSYATELDLIISVHAGYDIGISNPVHCTPEMSLEVLNEVNPSKLVLAHTGGFEEWDDVEKYLVGKDVYFDLSYSLGIIKQEQLLRIIEKHGAEKILFATDSPWGSQTSNVSMFTTFPIYPDDKEKILHQNAQKLLGI